MLIRYTIPNKFFSSMAEYLTSKIHDAVNEKKMQGWSNSKRNT